MVTITMGGGVGLGVGGGVSSSHKVGSSGELFYLNNTPITYSMMLENSICLG